MNLYLILYSVSIGLGGYYGYMYFKQYKNTSGLFFFIFTVLSCVWFVIYFLFFSGIQDKNILLIFSRANYGLSIGVLYSFLYFIKTFSSDKTITIGKSTKIGILAYLAIFGIYLCTDLVVKDLHIDSIGVYREVFGVLYFGHVGISLCFIPFFFFTIKKNFRQLSILNKMKLKYIMISVFLSVIFIIIFQLILPIYGIWMFEKEIIFVFLFFTLSVFYTLQRYFFHSIGYGMGKIVIQIISLGLSAGGIMTISSIQMNLNIGYWKVYNNLFLTIVVGIVLYTFFYNFLSKKFLSHFSKEELQNTIKKLEQSISHITHIRDLNIFLSHQLQNIFKTNFSEIVIFEKKSEKYEIQKYFENPLNEKIFINDVVFIEEKKNKFNKSVIQKELNKKSFICFPLYENEKDNIGYLTLGIKNFGDFYEIEEINMLKNFSFFLEYHLRYIKTYEKIQEFNIKLDKKVDEKTIEYNNLINKQKEFISLISHEIKSPLGAAIFQSDSILDDMMVGNLSKDELKNEVEILNNILIRIGDLSTKLFAVQYYDTHEVTLYKEPIGMKLLLSQEIDIFSHTNPDISFSYELDENIGFINIDKIQFLQVVQNIIANAIKFVPKKGGKIDIHAFKENNVFTLFIQDNGNGFEGIDMKNIFDKYSTSGGNNVGLGMGLYLCKKIISMHGGEITSGISEMLGGAKFCIHIPID